MLNAVFERSQAKGIARLVLLAIADRADDTGKAWCGKRDIAKRANIEWKNVFRIVAELCQLGELVRTGEKGPGGSNVYQIQLGGLKVMSSPGPQREAPGLKVMAGGPQGDGITPMNPNSTESPFRLESTQKYTVTYPHLRRRWASARPESTLSGPAKRVRSILAGLSEAEVHRRRREGLEEQVAATARGARRAGAPKTHPRLD